MAVHYWSFKGRISRGAFWRGNVALSAVMFAAIVAAVGSVSTTFGAWSVALIAAVILIALAGMLALSVRRLHDVGQPARLLLSPWKSFRVTWAMWFAKGDAGVNAYAPPPEQSRGSLELDLVVLAGALASSSAGILTLGIECKLTVTATGPTEQEADVRWRAEVERLHGARLSKSGIKLLSRTVCANGSCTSSARPCTTAE